MGVGLSKPSSPTQATTVAEPLQTLVSLYGMEVLLKLIEERIPSDQHAMLDYDSELLGENPPHLLANMLNKVVADFSKSVHDTTEELQTKRKQA